MDKSDLRLKHLKIRKDISEAARKHMSSLIFIKLQAHLQQYQSVGVYLSTALEVDTSTIIEYLWTQKKKVCVPKIVHKKMVFVDYDRYTPTKETRMGIKEPMHSHLSEPVELMLVPMLAYNNQAYRLGYGKGYYDAYLKSYDGLKLGLCFDVNKECLLIQESHDIACDLILTNSEDIIP